MHLSDWLAKYEKFMKKILLIILNEVLFFFAGKTRRIERKLELELIQGCFQLYSL